jgi:hypothetical protein
MDQKRSKKICDLCGEAVARVLCESDEAALCWGCDAAVHGANFLVARHVRALLCRACLGPTSWLASGARVDAAASVCRGCSEREEHGVEKGEGEGENQVVPLKLAPPVSDDSSDSSALPVVFFPTLFYYFSFFLFCSLLHVPQKSSYKC